MKYKAGDKFKCIKDLAAHVGKTAVKYTIGQIYTAHDFNGDVCIKDDSGKHSVVIEWSSSGIYKGISKCGECFEYVPDQQFKVGDRVIRLKQDDECLFLIKGGNVATASCQHEWKVYHGFRHDDEYCTKCNAIRPLTKVS